MFYFCTHCYWCRLWLLLYSYYLDIEIEGRAALGKCIKMLQLNAQRDLCCRCSWIHMVEEPEEMDVGDWENSRKLPRRLFPQLQNEHSFNVAIDIEFVIT